MTTTKISDIVYTTTKQEEQDNIKEYKDYLLVESVGEYFNTRYEVLKKDFYYTNEQEKKNNIYSLWT